MRRKAFKDLSVIEQKEGGDVSGAEVQIRISDPCFWRFSLTKPLVLPGVDKKALANNKAFKF